jgi:hypothetical protein
MEGDVVLVVPDLLPNSLDDRDASTELDEDIRLDWTVAIKSLSSATKIYSPLHEMWRT